jgi:hypothetical protein
MTPEELNFRLSLKDKPNPAVRFDANMVREIGFRIAMEVKPLKERIAQLEKKIEQRKYVGVWAVGKYHEGNLVTHDGSMWHCNEEPEERPGSGPSWTLAIKRGRDGKDGAGASRRPTVQRSHCT